jgi:FkbM family methyltransferase
MDVRPLNGTGLLRTLHGLVPLGRKYHPLLSLLNGRHGLAALPFGGAELVHPLAWSKAATGLLLAGEGYVPEVRLLPPILESLRDGLLVDVGANIGIYPLLFRRHSNLPIAAFEPQPLLFRLLEACVRRNRWTGVECHNLACGDAAGEVPFSIGLNGEVATGDAAREAIRLADLDLTEAIHDTHAARKSVMVPLARLDDALAGRKVAFLKIDCEGFEFRILSGARRLLAEQKPILFIEVHPLGLEKFGSSARAVLDLLSPDYDLEGWDFSESRFGSKLSRSLAKHRPTSGRKFGSMEAFLAAATEEPRPTQLYLVGRPKT